MRLRCLSLLFLLYAFLFASQARAMPMVRHNYDLTSLVYMSTNIVIANISENQQHKFTVTVTQTLYGSLHYQITGLERYRGYYKPLEDGMKVVLFLNRGRDITPSGVFLIDSSGHVHKYLEDNEGYIMLPTEYESLPLPSIEETTNRIATAVKAVEPIRSLLEKAPTRDDVPALLHLLDRTSNDTTDCSLRLADAISDRAFENLLSLNEPDVALRAYAVRKTNESQGFVDYGIQNTAIQDFHFFDNAERVRYLSKVLLDRNEDLALRMAAADILRSHSTAQIQTASRKIFADVSENPRLRALCLHLVSFTDSGTVAAIKRVYRNTHSGELRFAIEDAFMTVSDDLYKSLNSSTGGVTSIVHLVEGACTRMAYKEVAFRVEYRVQKTLWRQHIFLISQYLLTNLKTGQKVEIAPERTNVLSDRRSVSNGAAEFELSELPNFPDGEYSIVFQEIVDGKPLPPGHGARFKIRKTSKGTEVSMNNPKAAR